MESIVQTRIEPNRTERIVFRISYFVERNERRNSSSSFSIFFFASHASHPNYISLQLTITTITRLSLHLPNHEQNHLSGQPSNMECSSATLHYNSDINQLELYRIRFLIVVLPSNFKSGPKHRHGASSQRTYFLQAI
jgi:hypothetical protein